jgi:site-specific recombinase XerD
MKRQPTFAALLESFFTQRLMQQRRASAHTIASYRDTFRLLLRFIQTRLAHAGESLFHPCGGIMLACIEVK